ncbi:MAG: hypothetical protein FWH27_01440 [Planctomycetaceae bacterium]|nr:hypothetical protein [Planctomycetaceae bacterium]
MNYRSLIPSCLFMVWLLPLFGCGGQKLPPGMPKLYPATVTVMQDGRPLEGAEIVLINTDPAVNWSAGGMTDKNGVVKLRTMGQYEGAPLGRYKVGVRKVEVPDIALPLDIPSDPEGLREYQRLAREIAENTFSLVEEQFSIGRTQLEVEITASNDNGTVDVSPAIRVKIPAVPRG